MFTYLWESKKITGLIVNLSLSTFLIDRFFYQFFSFLFAKFLKDGSILNSLQNGLAVPLNRLCV